MCLVVDGKIATAGFALDLKEEGSDRCRDRGSGKPQTDFCRMLGGRSRVAGGGAMSIAIALCLSLLCLLPPACGDLLPVNRGQNMGGKKPITIWPLQDAQQMHVHCVELAEALPILLPAGYPVLDLGCGVGYYVSELAKRGYTVHAAEGTPGIEAISIHKPIHQADLSEPITLNFPHGHVMSFEVAEHLSAEDEDTFLDNVIKFCAGRLLLSWALPAACAPGRGHGHLNCRSNLYVVRRLFLRGFTFHAVDTAWLRAKVAHTEAFWFKETLLVFDLFPPPSLSAIKAGELTGKGPQSAYARATQCPVLT